MTCSVIYVPTKSVVKQVVAVWINKAIILQGFAVIMNMKLHGKIIAAQLEICVDV